jgi:hypothetical protein
LTEKILNLELQIKKLFKENEKFLGLLGNLVHKYGIMEREQKILKGDLFDCYYHHYKGNCGL